MLLSVLLIIMYFASLVIVLIVVKSRSGGRDIAASLGSGPATREFGPLILCVCGFFMIGYEVVAN